MSFIISAKPKQDFTFTYDYLTEKLESKHCRTCKYIFNMGHHPCSKCQHYTPSFVFSGSGSFVLPNKWKQNKVKFKIKN